MKTNAMLKHFLKVRGFKQNAVAEGIGMKPKAFNAMLNDHSDLKADTLIDVFRFTGTKPEAFFNQKIQAEKESTA